MSNRRGVRGWLSALAAAALTVALSAPASAQNDLNVDANIFWANTASYTGDSGGAACWHGTITVTQLATSIFNNQTINPILTNVASLTSPDWSPMGGSPALRDHPSFRAVDLAGEDPWFTPTCFVGAADYGDRWWEGWTYFNYAGGAGRTDIPAGPAIDVFGVTSDTTWTTGSLIRVNGRCAVYPGNTLTIQPGVVVVGAGGAGISYLVVERDADLVANGTAGQPIIFTSSAAPGQQQPGDWGGVVIHGKAVANCAGPSKCELTSIAGDCTSEGGAGNFGGNDDGDSSGSIRYARVEYAGFEISANNELNAWTFNAVGSGTTLEYLQAHLGLDDTFEFFGGTGRAKYLVSTGGDDDNLDWQLGYRGRVQFMVVQQSGTANEDSGIEADNSEFGNDCPGRSSPIVSNVTFVGGPNSDFGIRFRRGTAGAFVNSIITGFKVAGIRVESSSLNVCASQTGIPDADCNSLQLGVPGDRAIAPGIVVAAAPNPTRGPANISFSLEKGGKVQVQIFDVSGRLVETLVEGSMPAGEQNLRWDGGTGSGVFFYRVVTDEGNATGKLMVTR